MQARTLKQVTGQPKKMLQDLMLGLAMELRQGLLKEGKVTTEGTEVIVGLLRTAIADEQLSREPECFNVDEQLLQSMKEMLETRRAYDMGGDRRAHAERTAELVGKKVEGFTCAEAKAAGRGSYSLKVLAEGHQGGGVHAARDDGGGV